MVKRYGIVSAWAGHAVAPAKNGRFVDFADYAALQAENERLKAERVDLEKFRSVLEYAYMWGGNEVSSSLYEELSALIDAHKGE